MSVLNLCDETQKTCNKATPMNNIVDRFKCGGDKSGDHEAEAEPRQFSNCKLPFSNLLENGAFLITDSELHYELANKGWYGSRYEAQYDIELDEKIILKGEFVWALTPEELIYLVCERQIFEVTYRMPSGIQSYTKDELYLEIMCRNLTEAFSLTVYRELRTLGYVVRCDNNYGGIFTIYEGNPAKHHSAAIIYHEKDDILEYSAFLRVGNTVNKSVIVAALLSDPIDEDCYDLSKVNVRYTLYDMERPEGLALAFN
uniref:tRNA-intron lyase n=1 Tax=Panagrolaimus sp. ES5 TaxID=591445 RepID=A0AC34GSC9_9BILA